MRVLFLFLFLFLFLSRLAHVALPPPAAISRRPAAYARLWKLLATVHHHLSERRAITQRALYYLLCARHPKLFPPGRARLVAAALRDAVTLLNCTRAAMGVTSASRGQVAGRVAILTPEDGVWRDFSDASAHFVVPGDVRAVERARLRSDARFVLIVEKDAAFDKLCRERIHARVPCVLVTAKGFPDLATRAFLKKFASEFPRVPMLALVDWNPSGLLILRTYRAGSGGGALEASRYALDVKWLGVRRADLERVDARARQPLTELDKAKIKNMLAAGNGYGRGRQRTAVAALFADRGDRRLRRRRSRNNRTRSRRPRRRPRATARRKRASCVRCSSPG